MNCTEAAPLIDLLPVDALEDAERASLDDHRQQCAGCDDRAGEILRVYAAAEESALAGRVEVRAADTVGAVLARFESPPKGAGSPRVTAQCTFCHAGLKKDDAVYCASCLAPCHADCFLEHGRCSTAGCSETSVVRRRAPGTPVKLKPRRFRRATVIPFLVGAAAAAAIAGVYEVRQAALRENAEQAQKEAAKDPLMMQQPLIVDGQVGEITGTFDMGDVIWATGGVQSPLAGVWDGGEWGEVRIAADGLTGTYSREKHHTGQGRFRFEMTAPGKFVGRWGESEKRCGTLAFELTPGNDQVVGNWWSDANITYEPSQSGSLSWVRPKTIDDAWLDKQIIKQPTPAVLRGMIVAVKNDVIPPLVLISIGSDDGVQEHQRFVVHRDQNEIGELVVEKVLRDSAGCRVAVLTGAGVVGVQAGDAVALQTDSGMRPLPVPEEKPARKPKSKQKRY